MGGGRINIVSKNIYPWFLLGWILKRSRRWRRRTFRPTSAGTRATSRPFQALSSWALWLVVNIWNNKVFLGFQGGLKLGWVNVLRVSLQRNYVRLSKHKAYKYMSALYSVCTLRTIYFQLELQSAFLLVNFIEAPAFFCYMR